MRAETPSFVSKEERGREESARLMPDDDTWQVYTEVMAEVMRRDRVMGKKVSAEEIQAVQEYLLLNCPLAGVPSPPGLASESFRRDDNNNVVETVHSSGLQHRSTFRERLQEQRREFLRQSNFTEEGYEYSGRCLLYMADSCARKQLPRPCVPAWRKLRECGLAPREKAVSTFLYVLFMPIESAADVGRDGVDTGMESLQHEASLDVAVFHDLLFAPNEKTVSIRIKDLITKGEAPLAEQILASLPDKPREAILQEGDEALSSWKRLRTYVPILQYYCDTGNMASALRLYREMQLSEGVILCAETYALVIAAAARHGWFRVPHEQPIAVRSCDISPHGFSSSPGPPLFDELASEMADDILELDEASASIIADGFNKGFETTANMTVHGLSDVWQRLRSWLRYGAAPVSGRRLFVGRVSVDSSTAICPESGATLRLFTLTHQQRKSVRGTLLQMAAAQHEEFGDKLLARRQGKSHNDTKPQGQREQSRNGTYALDQLLRFSDWLQLRGGDPFTAFIDGPNVAYYGHGDVRWSQVELVLNKLEAMGEAPLVIMPQKYVASKFWLSSIGRTQELSKHEMAIVSKLIDTKKMYVVSSACLDDYYWMLSSVAEQKPSRSPKVASDYSGRLHGVRPILITNDQMRDHRLSLLNPRLFRRWTSCHIVKYDIQPYIKNEWDNRNVTLFPADFFSREIQGNSAARLGEGTAWHFPVAEWPEPDRLCVTLKRS